MLKFKTYCMSKKDHPVGMQHKKRCISAKLVRKWIKGLVNQSRGMPAQSQKGQGKTTATISGSNPTAAVTRSLKNIIVQNIHWAFDSTTTSDLSSLQCVPNFSSVQSLWKEVTSRGERSVTERTSFKKAHRQPLMLQFTRIILGHFTKPLLVERLI